MTHPRLADGHFGVGDVDAAVEDWRCESSADADVDLRFAIGGDRGRER